MASGRCVGQRPDGHTFDIFKRLYLAYFWVYLHQTWGFCKAWSALYDYCLVSNREGLGTSL